jgi:hypothetical protein
MPTIRPPRREQAGYILGWIWIFAVAFVLFSGYIAFRLIQLESGQAQVVKVWPIVDEIHRAFGFWPAILCAPVLGLLYLLALAWKLRSIRKVAESAQ